MKKTFIFLLFLSTIFFSFAWLNHHLPQRKYENEAFEQNEMEESKQKQKQMIAMLADPTTGKIPEGIYQREHLFAKNIPNATNPAGKPLGVWESRGPANIGGRTRAFALDVTDENKMFAGGVSGGLWASYLGGLLWSRASPSNLTPSVSCIAQDKRPGKTNTWYYGTGELWNYYGFSGSAPYAGDGIFKSTNGGATWTQIPSTGLGSQVLYNDFQFVSRIVIDPVATSDVILVATVGNIYRSTNGGTNWTGVLGSFPNFSAFTDIAVTSTGVYYATLGSDGSQKGIFRSTNGTNWTDITPANFPAEYGRVVIGINPNNENEVYFLGNTPNSGYCNPDYNECNSLWKYTYLSGNGAGANGTWEDRSQNLPSTGTIADKFFSQGGYDLVVKVQPNTNNVFIGGTNLYRSTDGFATSNNTTQIGGYKIGVVFPDTSLNSTMYPNHHPDQHELAFSPSNPNILYSASDGGVIQTMNCNAPQVSWVSLNNGYTTTQFYSVALDHASPGDSTIVAGAQDNGFPFVNDISPTAPWHLIPIGDGCFGAIANHKQSYYLSAQNGLMGKFKLDAAGNILAWQRIDPIGGKDYLFVNPFALDQNNNDIMYLAGGKYLFRNDSLSSIPLNGALDSISTGWTKLPDSVAAGHIVSSVAVSKIPANVVYYGTDKGKIYKLVNANVGTPSPIDVSIPGIVSGTYSSCLAIDPLDANKVIAVFSNYAVYSVYYTENGGASWQKVAGNLETGITGTGDGPSVRWASILLLPDGTKKYFIGTSVGLYSADSLVVHTANSPGTQWQKESDLGECIVNMIDTRKDDGLVAVATYGNGIFTKNYWNYQVKNDDAKDFAYNVSVYPNPTSDKANFKLSLPAAAEVEIELFNVKGDLVERKKEKTFAAGEEIYTLDLSKLAAGAYIYKVHCNQILKTGKLIVN